MATRLMNRNFVLLWQGQLVSQLGSQAFLVATMFWTMEATGSASLMGLFMMLATLPMVLLSPIAGTVADWYPRRAILITTDLLSGVAILLLAGLMYTRPHHLTLLVPSLMILGTVNGAIRTFFGPAVAAAIPDIVPEEQLAAANSLRQFTAQASTFVGQGLGGVLFRWLGAPLLYLIDGLTYLFSAIIEMFIRIPQRVPDRQKGLRHVVEAFKRDTLEGLSYVWDRRGMRAFLFSTAMVNFFAMPVFVLLPFYVTEQLGSGAAWYGFLLAAMSAGTIGGYTFAGAVRLRGRRRAALIIVALLGVGAAFVALGATTAPLVALALMAGVGILVGIINIYVLTLIQVATPSSIRGRVMGLVVTLTSAITPLGMAIGGVAGDLTGRAIPAVYAACGVVVIVVSLLAASRAPFRAFLSTDPRPARANADGPEQEERQPATA